MNVPVPVDRVLERLQEFLRLESASGIILMAAAALALVTANSPLAAYYDRLIDLPVEIRVGGFGIAKPLLLWVNDGLMAVFFLLIGLELKRELVEGHLSSPGVAALPAFAAVGGMLVPAAFYVAANWGDSTAIVGWAIPTATDIAFAMGVMALLGPRVPGPLKAFLLSIAIFDDLGAIVVIALFYTANLSPAALAVAAGLIIVLACLNFGGVTKPAAYILVGIALWVAVLKSGVHATLAGVVLAMFIPLRAREEDAAQQVDAAGPSRKLEHDLHPWVAFGVLPVFAFANAGVSLTGLSLGDLLHPVPLGIMTGLVLGKQIGVMVTCWVTTRLRITSLPDGVGWLPLYGTALLCGVGFTMSLFIASLAFEQGETAYMGLERIGILAATLVSGIGGYLVLRLGLNRTGGAS